MINSLKRMRGHKRLQSRVGRALKIERDVNTGASVVMISGLERMGEKNTRARLRLKLCENEETNRRALDLDRYSSLQPYRWTVLDLTLLLKANSARLFRIPLWMYSNNQHRGSVKESLWFYFVKDMLHIIPHSFIDFFCLLIVSEANFRQRLRIFRLSTCFSFSHMLCKAFNSMGRPWQSQPGLYSTRHLIAQIIYEIDTQ